MAIIKKSRITKCCVGLAELMNLGSLVAQRHYDEISDTLTSEQTTPEDLSDSQENNYPISSDSQLAIATAEFYLTSNEIKIRRQQITANS